MTRVAVCLSGCGYLDGAEIREAVLVLLALDRAGATVQCFAPDIPQLHVVDHRSGEVVAGETRNVLTESARIARGEIEALDQLDLDAFDALVFPGGFGVAKNLCDFAVKGPECTVDPTVQDLLQRAVARRLPVGLVCIAPALGAAALGGEPQVALTIGSDAGTAAAIESMGAKHVDTPVDRAHTDAEHCIVSTPAYMCDAPLARIAEGIDALVDSLLTLTSASTR